MSNYIYNPDSGELYHYGVKGMKWGVRRARGYAGPGHYVGNKRKIEGYKRDLQRLDNGEHLSIGIGKKRQAAYDARDRKALEKGIAKAEAKEAKKQAKKDATKAAVKDYSKKYNAASRASDLADAKWDAVKEQHKALGKNKVERILNAARNKSDAAKAYNKAFDEASAASDLADAKWNEAKAAYVNTGRNRVARVLNNARYS